jgi:hypothetical protein
MTEKDYILSILSILVGILSLILSGKKYYKGAMKRDLKFNVMGGKRWTGIPALIVALFNLLLAILLILIPLYFIIKDIFF